MNQLKKLALIALILAGAMVVGSTSAFAIGTAASTAITNTVTLNYTVNTVSQDAITDDVSFVVDRLVDLTVVNNDASNEKAVTPNETGAYLTYTVTNLGNDTQDYVITWSENGPDFPVDSYVLYYENGAAGYQGTEPVVPNSAGTYYIDEVSPISGTNSVVIYIVSTIPGTPDNGDRDAWVLTATAREGGAAGLGAAITEDTGADNAAAVQNVFGDNAGGDAIDEATGTYVVASAEVSVTKTSAVIYDPVNGATNPKRIPGALVQYTITIANASGATVQPAILNTITDILQAETTMDADLMTNDGSTPESAAGSGFKATYTRGGTPTGPTYYTTTSSADGIDLSGTTVTATMTTVLPAGGTYSAGELQAGDSVVIVFNVWID